jgi:alkaline phosphatase
MLLKLKSLISFRNLFLISFALYALGFQTGLGGCDSPPSTKDTSSTDQGDPVDVGGGTPQQPPGNPSGNPLPPGGGGPTTPPTVSSPVKNVILMIGGGMGPQQIGQVVQYRRMRLPSQDPLALEKLMDGKVMGMMTTHSYLDIVSDTASATSSMACGLKTRNDTVGLNANGEACETILEKAGKLGKSTGLVSTAPLSYPGVSGFLTHSLNSGESNEIASNLTADLSVNLLLAGGAENLIPSENQMKFSGLTDCEGIDEAADGYGRRDDQKNLVEDVKAKGYQFVCKKDQLNGLSASEKAKVLGVFSNSHFPRSPERRGAGSLPNLAEMTSKALELLGGDPQGFVLVVENSMTQLAAQENDAGTLLQEGLDFDAALGVALDYAEKNTDTLLILTSDHDTGGFSFAYSNQRGGSLDLPSGDRYDQPFNYAPAIRFDTLMEQQKSFYVMTNEVLAKLYDPSAPISLDEAAGLLVSDVQTNTKYSLGVDQAREVLSRPSGLDNAQTKDFSAFFVNDNIHSNLLGRAISPQTSTVWAAGTSTSTPVLVLAKGPAQYAERVRGLIDNSDIGKIIADALQGR